MEVIHDLLGYDGLKIYQDSDAFSFSIDSLLLASFINTNNAKSIIDLCTGNAPIPLYLTLKSDANIIGVEIQEYIASLAKKSVEINNIKNIEIINANLINIYKVVGNDKFDIVSCNPPYFKVSEDSHLNKNDYLSIARHELKCNFLDIAKEASRLLVDGGSFYFIHRCERIQEILTLLKQNNFGVKRMRFVYPKIGDNALLVLVEAKKNKADDVKVEEPLYIYLDNSKNIYTNEVLSIFNYKKV